MTIDSHGRVRNVPIADRCDRLFQAEQLSGGGVVIRILVKDYLGISETMFLARLTEAERRDFVRALGGAP